MTDDYRLFSDAGDADGEPVDPDIAIITAYLARELSPIQVAAVEQRLAGDVAFRRAVEPLLDAWSAGGAAMPRAGIAEPPPLTMAQHEAGWQRHLAYTNSQHTPALPRRLAQRSDGSITSTRRIPMTRIAATIAVIVLPMVVFAQVVVYAATHAEAPMHMVARRLAAPFVGSAPKPASDAGRPATATPAVADGPAARQLWDRILAGGAPGQSAPSPQPAPARPLGAVVARTPVSLGSVTQLVQLSDGRVLVADRDRRRLLMFDSSLARATVVLDSVMGQPNTFASGIGAGSGGPGGGRAAGPRSGGPGDNASGRGPRGAVVNTPHLLPFRGDSALWWDNTAMVYIVIDPAGKIARTMPPPPLTSLTPSLQKLPASSAPTGLVYQIEPRPIMLAARPAPVPRTDTTVTDDSSLVVRMDFNTHTIDTLGSMATGVTRVTGGRFNKFGFKQFEPFRFVDDLVATPDGSIVILHAREYRLEWISPNGTRTSQKLSYPWRRVTDEMRKYLQDSIAVLDRIQFDAERMKRASDSVRLGRLPIVTSPDAARRPLEPVGPDATGLDGSALAILGATFPDYYAPVPESSLRADADGNVWIKQILPVADPDHEVWEVVSRTRGVVDRVRIPNTRTLVGFGRGVVYLAAYNAGAVTLEKVRIR